MEFLNSQAIAEVLVSTTDIPKTIWLERGVVTKIETLTWNEYWNDASRVSQYPENIQHDIAVLNSSRHDSLQGKFNSIVTYCHAYFSLLHRVNQLEDSSPIVRRMLHKILGYEVIEIYHNGSRDLIGIIANRHPGYLLSRIKYRGTPDDPKYFPLIVAPPSAQSHDRVEAYYHYRQIKLVPYASSLLCYLPIKGTKRIAGFACYQTLNNATRRKVDPRSEFRANYIAERAIIPFLKSMKQQYRPICGCDDVNLADLGSGSGDLMRKLCIKAAEPLSNFKPSRRFSLTLVDVNFQKPYRHLRDKAFYSVSRHFRCVRSDFREWIEKQHLKGKRLFDVILMCRLLNNMSQFKVEWIDDWLQVFRFSKKRLSYHRWKSGDYLPHKCLAPQAIRTDNLLITNVRLPLLRGHTYPSPSLSDYYRGMWTLENKALKRGGETIFYAARRFDDSIFVDADGISMIGKLCRIGMLIVIEDVDVTPQVLRQHFTKFNLDHLAASDLTDRNKMRVSQLLCVCDRKYESVLPGRRII